ncbi:GIY-YIG nuclease family protein [Imperialibacter roseus]|uniref:GIY-YIG nuclease family protein n=1 Tax=Imperialibacter roseus TaxID=1324217 RepID=A0ABZ0IY77_9BACT|nr:GIY-YIG nuclease family protein [Imperialibacter roseus]WOK08617.1 GIY-YIG nuclease family protein [Imperialibacter roseus]
MNQYTVYILKCADGSYYTGVTNDIDWLLYEHKIGYDTKSYTFKRRPVELVFTEHFGDVNKAIAFEKQIKGWSRAKKEALMKQDWGALKELSKNSSGK